MTGHRRTRLGPRLNVTRMEAAAPEDPGQIDGGSRHDLERNV
jgi:hypothetical protein